MDDIAIMQARLETKLDSLADAQRGYDERLRLVETESVGSRERVNNIKEDLDSIKTGINRLVWLVVAVLVTAFLSLIINTPTGGG